MESDAEKRTGRFGHYLMSAILPLTRKQIPVEILAGVTLASIAIPEVMGYTQIAGMPVVTGLYTILIPTVLFAFFGSSRHLVVGADSATAAIMAAGLAGMAVIGDPQYEAYAGILALMAAGFLFIARLVKLGFLADFLSRTVLIGFLTGVGIQVAVSQFSGMLGIPDGTGNPVLTLVNDFKHLGLIHPYTLIISLLVLLVVVVCRRISRKLPGELIAVILSIVASYWLHLDQSGVKVLGAVPGGLPAIGLPNIGTVNFATLYRLTGIAFSMFIVILAQSAATARAYAIRYKEKLDVNLDLVGLGLANIGAGLSGAFVTNCSPTKTQIVDSAGGRTQLSNIITSVVTLLVLLFLTKPLAFMPKAVLATVVFMIGVAMIDLKGMRNIFKERSAEFWVALFTVLVVVLIGVEQGILLAIILSLLIHTRHGYKPKNGLISLDKDGKPHIMAVDSYAEILPGLMIYQFHHSMYYANTELMEVEILRLLDGSDPPITWFCIDATAVDDIDFSAAATLRELFATRKVRLVIVAADKHIRHELDVSEISNIIGEDGFFETAAEVVEAYSAATLAEKEKPKR